MLEESQRGKKETRGRGDGETKGRGENTKADAMSYSRSASTTLRMFFLLQVNPGCSETAALREW